MRVRTANFWEALNRDGFISTSFLEDKREPFSIAREEARAHSDNPWSALSALKRFGRSGTSPWGDYRGLVDSSGVGLGHAEYPLLK